MSQIPTAEETLRNYNAQVHDSDWRTLVAMREFAKLHVQAALKAAADNAEFKWHSKWMEDGGEIDEKSILLAYPLENIK